MVNLRGFTLIPIILVIFVVVLICGLYFGFSLISGMYSGNNYLDGVVVDSVTKTPLPNIKVEVSNRGWGFSNGQVVWDHDYVYAANTDSEGKFHIIYQVGPGAHVVITQNGYDRFDGYYNKNSQAVIELKKTL